MILAIDFDDVLCDSRNVKQGFKMGEPVDGAIDAMRLLKSKGHLLVIHTVRGNRPEHVEKWLDHFGIPYDEVTDLKPSADLYIDDKGLRFETWALTMPLLKAIQAI